MTREELRDLVAKERERLRFTENAAVYNVEETKDVDGTDLYIYKIKANRDIAYISDGLYVWCNEIEFRTFNGTHTIDIIISKNIYNDLRLVASKSIFF